MTTNRTTSVSTESAAVARGRSLPLDIARELGLVLAGAVAIALIGQISLPLPFTPVPVTLGTFAALCVGGVLGSRRALGSVGLFALSAALGAPVLVSWSSGVGASFGYVLGYGLAAAVAGHATSRTADGPRYGLLARLGLMLLASACVYVPGLIWLKAVTGVTWQAAVTLGLVPFIIGDVLKSVVASTLPTRRI
ncbi:biotin transporter BioY [Actinomyces howellii]|uniref:Biotin transporter n=1 Tax=Actinomyces howellii TaxID=52771 RepID=A0A3S4SP69_9ACTO|nr:biotin transporter BioY [Actinomyces howellii]VEG29781.1 Biotin ECF transporter S component BioY2 [Actinomyces howellii]